MLTVETLHLLVECDDHLLEVGERKVDMFSLIEEGTLHIRLTDAL